MITTSIVGSGFLLLHVMIFGFRCYVKRKDKGGNSIDNDDYVENNHDGQPEDDDDDIEAGGELDEEDIIDESDFKEEDEEEEVIDLSLPTIAEDVDVEAAAIVPPPSNPRDESESKEEEEEEVIDLSLLPTSSTNQQERSSGQQNNMDNRVPILDYDDDDDESMSVQSILTGMGTKGSLVFESNTMIRNNPLWERQGSSSSGTTRSSTFGGGLGTGGTETMLDNDDDLFITRYLLIIKWTHFQIQK